MAGESDRLGCGLRELAQHLNIQTRLRTKIHFIEAFTQALGDSQFTATDIDTMLYLQVVLKEILHHRQQRLINIGRLLRTVFCRLRWQSGHYPGRLSMISSYRLQRALCSDSACFLCKPMSRIPLISSSSKWYKVLHVANAAS